MVLVVKVVGGCRLGRLESETLRGHSGAGGLRWEGPEPRDEGGGGVGGGGGGGRGGGAPFPFNPS